MLVISQSRSRASAFVRRFLLVDVSALRPHSTCAGFGRGSGSFEPLAGRNESHAPRLASYQTAACSISVDASGSVRSRFISSNGG